MTGKHRGYQAAGHRSLALVELIIAIGALAAVSIVVMQLFVRAAQWESRSRDLDMACFETQSVIEVYKLSGAPTDLSPLWDRPVQRVSDSVWEIHYDSDWRPVNARPDKGFSLALALGAPEDGRLSITVTRFDPHLTGPDGETVFEVTDVYQTRREETVT